MAGGYRSAQPLLGLSAPPVTTQGGYRGLLFYWGGGASAPAPAPTQGGYRSLLAFWTGGAFAGRVVPPIPPTPDDRGGHSKDWRPIREDITTRRVRDDNEVALWLAQFVASQS